jgi:hypothetical protein
MSKYKGNMVSAAQTVLSGTAYTGKANGKFSLSEQIQAKQSSLWAKGLTVPNTPTAVSGTAANAKVVISFTAPAETGGLPITNYTVKSSPGNITATGISSPIEVIGLTNGTTYTFTVKAENSIGASVESSPSAAYLPTSGPAIGSAYGGGFYAGSISTTGNGVATHYLIVAPKATGETAVAWGPYLFSTGVTSPIAGPTNSASLAALGTDYAAATFCEGLTIGGYTDWYLPARDELEVLYYFLKPTTTANLVTVGSNPSAAAPEPVNTNYTTSSPPQTNAGIGFRTGETNAFESSFYFSSSEISPKNVRTRNFGNGDEGGSGNKTHATQRTRAVRRVAIL